jgi:hypothetical protein
MTRKLTVAGVVMAAAVALTALSTSNAGAVVEETVQAEFTAIVNSDETAKIDGEQLESGGKLNEITVEGLPALTCSTVKYNGEAVTEGPASEQVTITPEYSTCHVVIPFLGTRVATVTMNGCNYKVEATTTVTESEELHRLGDTDIECPEGKTIEIQVYSNSSGSDSGASTLCKLDIPPQNDLPGITLTNDVNTPTTVDDIEAHFNITSIQVNETGGSLCGEEATKATYAGKATLRATNKSSEFVEAQINEKKRIEFGSATPTLHGSGGTIQFTTEVIKVKCTSVTYEATPGARIVSTLTITPTYAGCTTEGGGLTTDVEPRGCVLKQNIHTAFTGTAPKTNPHTPGEMEISCPTNPLRITVTEGGNVKCEITFGTQVSKDSIVDLKNVRPTNLSSENRVRFTHTLKNLKYTVVKGEPAACGKNEELKDGQIENVVEVKAYEDAKKTKQVSFDIRGNV